MKSQPGRIECRHDVEPALTGELNQKQKRTLRSHARDDYALMVVGELVPETHAGIRRA